MPYYGQLFTDHSVYWYICNCSWNNKSSGIGQRGFSRAVYELSHGEKLDLKIYLFVWASLCVLSILFFKPSFCNDQKKNWNGRPT